RGPQRVHRRPRGLRPRLLPAAAADPPVQPHRCGAPPGADRAPGGLAVSADRNAAVQRVSAPVGTAPVGVDELLERVRAGYDRIGPPEAAAAAEAGALLVDIRYAALRDRDGLIPGALVVERNELEWRLDPQGSHRAAEAVGHDLRIVVICNEGYASSLAVA